MTLWFFRLVTIVIFPVIGWFKISPDWKGIADVFETKFLTGPVVIGRFILKELQDIADSSDATKRARGRRGLDILQRLQDHPDIQVKVYEKDYPEVRDVDGKLVVMARELGA